jgi:hypothetical protein
MKRTVRWSIVLLGVTLLAGCSGGMRHHPAALPDPGSYKAHFPDMDTNGDRLVNWDEFKSYFPETTPEVFTALDLDQDQAVDHDEWHAFKEAHGLKDH